MEQRISIERLEQAINIFGSFDENIRLLEQEFSVTVVNRDGELRVDGEPEDTMLAVKAIQALLTLSSRGESIGEQNVRYVIGLVRAGKEDQIILFHCCFLLIWPAWPACRQRGRPRRSASA